MQVMVMADFYLELQNVLSMSQYNVCQPNTPQLCLLRTSSGLALQLHAVVFSQPKSH